MVEHRSRLESAAFVVILLTMILAPIVFWPSPYLSLETVKTMMIVSGVAISAILFGFVSMREKKVVMPPKAILFTGLFVVISLAISGLLGVQADQSFFGQGFEINTVGFMVILFLALLVSFLSVHRLKERAVVMYVGVTISFVILALLHVSRFIFGPSFASFSIFNSLASSPIGSWYGWGIFSAVVAILSLVALSSLTLSRGMKILYSAVMIIATASVFLVNFYLIWFALVVIFAGLVAYFFYGHSTTAPGNFFKVFLKKIAWLPLIALLVSLAICITGDKTATPVVKGLVNYQELSLPWQYSLDVISGTIKNEPFFGTGPNNFVRSFMSYKPISINMSDAWSAEFSYGSGLLPTFIATQGVVGAILWILFSIFFGICGARVLKKSPSGTMAGFVELSSFSVASFLWLMMILTVPPHAVILLAFVMTGIFLGSSCASGSLVAVHIDWNNKTGLRVVIVKSLVVVVMVIIAVIGIVYVKKTTALVYFGMGVKQLTSVGSGGDVHIADKYFAKAGEFDESDVYYQARAEATLAEAGLAASTINKNSDASTTKAVATEVTELINQAYLFADNAVAYDPSNYYNYLSQARISEAANGYGMTNGYEAAVSAYMKAANINPLDPSIYLSLARLQASANKLDDALKTVGTALQLKGNYLDGIFLLSQIEAAKGDLANAISAAKFATQINPNNAALFFQLGMLQYNAKSYSDAAEALTTAITIQPDYANAQYFLGLSYARLGKNSEAIEEFNRLAVTNPDNQEVALILRNLQAGKSPFTDAKPPVSTSPEKRTKLPIK